VLAQREAAARAFSPALALGVLSAREVLHAARRASDVPLSAADAPLWGRASAGCACILVAHACTCTCTHHATTDAHAPGYAVHVHMHVHTVCTRHTHAVHVVRS